MEERIYFACFYKAFSKFSNHGGMLYNINAAVSQQSLSRIKHNIIRLRTRIIKIAFGEKLVRYPQRSLGFLQVTLDFLGHKERPSFWIFL